MGLADEALKINFGKEIPIDDFLDSRLDSSKRSRSAVLLPYLSWDMFNASFGRSRIPSLFTLADLTFLVTQSAVDQASRARLMIHLFSLLCASFPVASWSPHWSRSPCAKLGQIQMPHHQPCGRWAITRLQHTLKLQNRQTKSTTHKNKGSNGIDPPMVTVAPIKKST